MNTDISSSPISHKPEIVEEVRRESVTEINISNLTLNRLRQIKSKLYQMIESANRLNIGIQVVNLDEIQVETNICTHLMESCNRKTDFAVELKMLLKGLISSESRQRIHKIKLVS